MPRLLAACAGFLLAVLWMDLMFDFQALGGPPVLPEAVLSSIAAYYARVTTRSWPLGAAIGTVMAIAVGGALIQVLRRCESRRRDVLGLVLVAVPVGLALLRVFPNAVHLGMSSDPAAARTDLARAILHDHLVCLVFIAGFLALQLSDRSR